MSWLKSKKTVAVHSGNFHADEIFSVAVLSLYLKEKLKIIRTRDDAVYLKADYVFDVGQEYNPAKNKFDHHQVGGVSKRPNGIPYATLGLVWREFGVELTGSQEASEIIDKKLIAPIDADDNALEICSGFIFDIRPYSVSDYIIYRNSVCEESERQSVFEELVIWAKDLIRMELKIVSRYLDGCKKIEVIYNSTSDKRLIIFDQDYEGIDILANYPEPLFVVRPYTATDFWKISCVKIKGEKFKNRVYLPASWGGLRNGELAKVTGVEDALYCHHQCFMAIAKTKEGATKLAKLALEN